MLITRFLHFLGSAMWIGGALAAMVIAITSRPEPTVVRLGAFRLLTQVHTVIIGIGALLTTGTGFLLTMWLAQSGGGMVLGQPRIWIMQVTGIVGALLTLLIGVPTAVKIGGLAVPGADGGVLPAFERLRKRQAVVSSVAGVLALVALFAGVVLR